MAKFCDLASEGPDIIMHQLKSIYNSPFKDSHSHPIHTCFAMIASNVSIFLICYFVFANSGPLTERSSC